MPKPPIEPVFSLPPLATGRPEAEPGPGPLLAEAPPPRPARPDAGKPRYQGPVDEAGRPRRPAARAPAPDLGGTAASSAARLEAAVAKAVARPAPAAAPTPARSTDATPAKTGKPVKAAKPAATFAPESRPPAARPNAANQPTQPTAHPAADTTTSPLRHRRTPRGMAVLTLQARALQHARLGPAASAVVDELARQLDCARVSLGFEQRGRMRVVAMSDTADVDPRQSLVRALGAAMDEAATQRANLMHPLPPGTALLASTAHAALADQNGRLGLYTVPLYALESPIDPPPAIGALLLEREGGFDADTIAAAQDAASFVGPVLALQHQLDQPVSGRLVQALQPRGTGPGGLSRGQWLASGAALLLLGAALWPSTYRVVATARVEGLGQQVLAAPLDGFVASATLRPGANVKAGQLLMALDDKDLKLDAAKWQAEVAQLDKKYRESQTSDDAAPIVLARARLEQAQAQLDMVQQQLARVRLKAPFDGVLMSGDFTQAVGAPVKRGQELMTVAPDRGFRIVAEVDEQDVARLREQQRAEVLFGALDGQALPLQITRIAPVSSVLEGRNVFEVDAGLDTPAAGAALRPGMRGVVRIDIEPRLQGWIWWHQARQWLQRLSWRLFA